MTVDLSDGGIIGNRDMAGRNTNKLSVLLVQRIDRQEALTLTGLGEHPEVGEGSQARAGNVMQMPALEVRHQVVGRCQT